ncbi:hypothetical protein A2U01_0038211, partial [Trifolium medium]|nr:hypothetical protein [Trifolium medium]
RFVPSTMPQANEHSLQSDLNPTHDHFLQPGNIIKVDRILRESPAGPNGQHHE